MRPRPPRPPVHPPRQATASRWQLPFFPIETVVDAVGADGVDVVTLVPPGEEAHEYEPTAEQVTALEDADVVFYLGGDFQPGVEDALASLPSDVRTVDLLDGLTLLPITDPLAGVEGEVEGEVLEDGSDPHVWLDPTNMAAMGDVVADVLGELSPSAAHDVRANAAAFPDRHGDARRARSGRYDGLREPEWSSPPTAPFQYLTEALRPGPSSRSPASPRAKNPRPRTLEAVAEPPRGEPGVTTIFFEENLPEDLARTLADEIGAEGRRARPARIAEQGPARGGRRPIVSVMLADPDALAAGLPLFVSAAPLLAVHDLGVRYGDRVALEHVDFTVERGELIGVIGPNGAGKSTLFRAICGLVKHEGSVDVNGVHCHDHLDRMDIAYIPQRNDSDLLFPITVGELVMAGRRRFRSWYRRASDDDRAATSAALEAVNLGGFEHRSLIELSGGQLHRAYLARALTQRASVLLLDEALSGVDRPTTLELFDLFGRLAAEGTTLLVATHDLAIARRRFAAASPSTARSTVTARPRSYSHPRSSTARSVALMHWLTDPFQSEFMQRAFLAAIIIGVVAPVVGTWIVLRRMANLGDAMSHGTLAGVALAYAAGVNILFGAMGAGLLIGFLLLAFSSNRRLGQETIIAVLGTAFFALGVVVISRLDTGVELTHFLFGRLLTITWGDIWLNLVLGGLAVLVVVLMFGELRLATFDHVQAEQVGVRVEVVQAVLVLLLSIVVVISLRAVGTIMSVTMLVTPAATARLLSRTLRQMT